MNAVFLCSNLKAVCTQAQWRGVVARSCYKESVDSIVRLQAHVRGWKARQSFNEVTSQSFQFKNFRRMWTNRQSSDKNSNHAIFGCLAGSVCGGGPSVWLESPGCSAAASPAEGCGSDPEACAWGGSPAAAQGTDCCCYQATGMTGSPCPLTVALFVKSALN